MCHNLLTRSGTLWNRILRMITHAKANPRSQPSPSTTNASSNRNSSNNNATTNHKYNNDTTCDKANNNNGNNNNHKHQEHTHTHTHTPTNTVCCRLRATKSSLCRNKSTSLWGWYSIFRTNEQLEAFWIYTNLEFPTVSHTDFWSQGSTKTMRALSTNATTCAEVPVKHVLPSSTDKAA